MATSSFSPSSRPPLPRPPPLPNQAPFAVKVVKVRVCVCVCLLVCECVCMAVFHRCVGRVWELPRDDLLERVHFCATEVLSTCCSRSLLSPSLLCSASLLLCSSLLLFSPLSIPLRPSHCALALSRRNRQRADTSDAPVVYTSLSGSSVCAFSRWTSASARASRTHTAVRSAFGRPHGDV